MKIVVDEKSDKVIDLALDMRDIVRIGSINGDVVIETKTAEYVLKDVSKHENVYAIRYGDTVATFWNYSKLQYLIDKYLG